MRGARIIAAVAALAFALFAGVVFVGMSRVGDPNVVLASVVAVICLLAAVVIAIGPARWAGGVAIALGLLSGLAAAGTFGMAAPGFEMAFDVIWLGITTVALVGEGLRLLRQPGHP
jgi:hypothetical protein